MKGCREIRRGSRKVHVCDGPSALGTGREALSEAMTSERLFCSLGVANPLEHTDTGSAARIYRILKLA